MRLIHLEEVDSTSAHLRRLTEGPGAPPPPWTVVLADRQTAGYGMRGRSWHSDAGGLYATVLLGPEVIAPVFTLLAGVAVLGACREVSGARGLGLKWVNDLVWHPPEPGAPGRKVGGLLVELTHRRHLLLGIGVNLRPLALEDAAGLDEAAGQPVDRLELLGAVMRHVDDGLAARENRGDASVIGAWLADAVTIGREVRVETGTETLVGTAVGLEADGRLRIQVAGGGVRTVGAGTVRLADGRYA